VLKKTIAYKDLDGVDISEDFYFGLSKAELAKIELQEQEGMKAKIDRIIASNNKFEIIEIFSFFLNKSIGRRSEDNKRFMKSEEITQEFLETDAYSVLFMELITDAKAGVEFIKGIMPTDLTEMLMMAGHLDDAVEAGSAQKALADYTNDELLNMSSEAFRELVDRHRNGKSIPQKLLLSGFARNTK